MTAAGRQHVLVVLGTRPEASELAPVVLRLQAEPQRPTLAGETVEPFDARSR